VDVVPRGDWNGSELDQAAGLRTGLLARIPPPGKLALPDIVRDGRCCASSFTRARKIRRCIQQRGETARELVDKASRECSKSRMGFPRQGEPRFVRCFGCHRDSSASRSDIDESAMTAGKQRTNRLPPCGRGNQFCDSNTLCSACRPARAQSASLLNTPTDSCRMNSWPTRRCERYRVGGSLRGGVPRRDPVRKPPADPTPSAVHRPRGHTIARLGVTRARQCLENRLWSGG